jgi:hypothetical protein
LRSRVEGLRTIERQPQGVGNRASMTNDELMSLGGVVFKDGELWALPANGRPVPITGPHAEECFRNLRNSSLLMYQTLTHAEQWCELFVVFLEAANANEAVSNVLKMQAAIRVSRRCAIEGLENIADMKKPT